MLSVILSAALPTIRGQLARFLGALPQMNGELDDLVQHAAAAVVAAEDKVLAARRPVAMAVTVGYRAALVYIRGAVRAKRRVLTLDGLVAVAAATPAAAPEPACAPVKFGILQALRAFGPDGREILRQYLDPTSAAWDAARARGVEVPEPRDVKRVLRMRDVGEARVVRRRFRDLLEAAGVPPRRPLRGRTGDWLAPGPSRHRRAAGGEAISETLWANWASVDMEVV